MTINRYEFGTGRRKTAIAQARLVAGSGRIFIKNAGKDVEIKDEATLEKIKKPLSAISKEKEYDVTLIYRGGGFSSQKDAALLAIARTLSKINPEWELILSKEGYLTRDPREKERKKPGLKRARRAPQWAKR